ncbi:hypothetical protein EM868_00275 [Cupriavidus gilardii]|uniref:capsid cement protein n=1 Tax=Cupriavidus gilardii TaxID=82541 RepID=UPI001EE5B802|nr:hypothetical protein [Cupriavidus gilardii]MCG5260388.1 hypothetical protein [Cupriavidus gilardii]MDF9428239.1 hypothetical protein [Cupriavidus gilardii]
MLTNKRILIGNFIAQGAVAAYRLVAYGDQDDTVKLATGAAGEKLRGVSCDADAADGKRVDIAQLGIAPVIYGAAVARGDRVKADAEGRAIPIAAGDAFVGVAEVAGVAGDRGAILIAHG